MESKFQMDLDCLRRGMKVTASERNPIHEYIASRNKDPFEAPVSLVDQRPTRPIWTRLRAMPQFDLNAASAWRSFWNNK